jgi:hypothetical protein
MPMQGRRGVKDGIEVEGVVEATGIYLCLIISLYLISV